MRRGGIGSPIDRVRFVGAVSGRFRTSFSFHLHSQTRMRDMKSAPFVLLSVLAVSITGCASKPNDKQIQGAALEYIIGQDFIKTLELLEDSDPNFDSSKLDVSSYPKNGKIISYHSAGCAKSQTSDGYVCTISISASFDRSKIDPRPGPGFDALDGPYLFHLDKSHSYNHETDGWEVVNVPTPR